MQRRVEQVDHYPGELSISLTGHVEAGENSSAALYREVQEELGLDSAIMKFEFLFSYRQDHTIHKTYIDGLAEAFAQSITVVPKTPYNDTA
jgi:8-oxo-dGTP pyrophosphatase MutT (NUDIX family)